MANVSVQAVINTTLQSVANVSNLSNLVANVTTAAPTAAVNASSFTTLVNVSVAAVNATVNGTTTLKVSDAGAWGGTPSPDDGGLKLTVWHWVHILTWPVVILVCCTVAFFYCRRQGARAIGNAIEHGIEYYDKHYLGVDVNIDDLEVDAAHAMIVLGGLTVDNPPGYTGPYLAKIGKVVLDLDLNAAACSMGKKVVIEEATLSSADIQIETHLMAGTSNVQEILKHLEGEHPKQQEEPPKDEKEAKKPWYKCCSREQQKPGKAADAPVAGYQKLDDSSPSPSRDPEAGNSKDAEAGKEGKKAKPQEQDKVEIEIKKLSLKDANVKLSGVYVSLSDIEFTDFSEEQKKNDRYSRGLSNSHHRDQKHRKVRSSKRNGQNTGQQDVLKLALNGHGIMMAGLTC